MLRRLLEIVWYLCAALVVVAALTLSLGRLALPLLEARAGQLEALVKETVGQDIAIGRMELGWYGFGPELRMHDVVLGNGVDTQPPLKARELRIALDTLRSLWAREPVPSRLVLLGSELSLNRTAEGKVAVQGIHVQTPQSNPWLLVLAQPHVELRNIHMRWHDEMAATPDLVLSNIDLRLRNSGQRHQLQVDLQLPAAYGTQLHFSADLRGTPESFADWRGEMFVAFGQASLGNWLARHTPAGWHMDGMVGATLWATLDAGALQHMRGALQIAQPTVVRTDVKVPAFTAERLATRLDWRREQGGWELNLAGFQVDRAGQASAASAMTLRQENTPDGLRQWRFAADQLRLENVLALLPFHPDVTPEQRARLQRLQATGYLRDIRVDATTRTRSEHDALAALVYRLQFQDLHSAAVDRLPGVAALSGRVSGDLQHGVMELDSRAAQVDLPKLFRAPLQLAQLSGRIDWRNSDDRLRVQSDSLRAENADIRTLSRLRLEIPSDGSKPFLALQSEFTDGNVESTHKYLPVGIMPPRTVAWLDRALVSGRLHDGALLFQGRFGAFPFDRADGRLEIRATVSDGVLDYQEGWHRIEGLEAELAFINRSMQIRGVAGKILGSDLPEVKVRIDDLARARLDIDGQATGPLADMLRFLRDSPLGAGRREALDALQASGDARLLLSIRQPLAKTVPGTLAVDGRLHLPGNRLDMPDLTLEQLKGELHFTQSGIDGRDLRARLLGVPVKLDVADAPDGEPLTRVRAVGNLPLVERLRKEQPTFTRINGKSEWTAALYLPKRTASGVPARVELISDLNGIEVDLPEPFGKPAEAATTFALAAELQGRALGPIRLRYGNHSAALVMIPDKPQRLVRGTIKLGATDATLPEVDGLRVEGRVALFAWDDWRELLGGDAESGVLRAVNVEIDNLHAFGRIFSGVQIRAQRDAGHWVAALGGPDMDGTLELPPDKPLRLRCAWLHIPPAVDTEKTPGSVTWRTDPAKLPPLDVEANKLQFRAMELGHVTLKSHPMESGMEVDKLQVDSDWLHLGAQGQWTRQTEQDASRFRIEIQGGDLGKMLTAFGYTGSIQGGETKGVIDANWSGTPAEFSLAKLDGSLDLQVGKGRLLNVEAGGAGRVVGLFSLQGLRRRLALDFSDVFAKGFSFDRITGRFTLQGGDAYTDNLVIESPAADIKVTGRTGLVKHDYDQLVTVSPQVQSTIPIAGAIAGGPAVGAALLLADTLFSKQMQGLARYQYTVTGSWEEPKFQSVTRESARGLQEKTQTGSQPPAPVAPPPATDQPQQGIQ